jgi:hypothetical protein
MSTLTTEKMLLADGGPPGGGEVVEINLLLEPWLLKAVEASAREQGMTSATMVRRLLRDFVYYSDGLPKPP